MATSSSPSHLHLPYANDSYSLTWGTTKLYSNKHTLLAIKPIYQTRAGHFNGQIGTNSITACYNRQVLTSALTHLPFPSELAMAGQRCWFLAHAGQCLLVSGSGGASGQVKPYTLSLVSLALPLLTMLCKLPVHLPKCIMQCQH